MMLTLKQTKTNKTVVYGPLSCMRTGMNVSGVCSGKICVGATTTAGS
jgi:hypothetical protein